MDWIKGKLTKMNFQNALCVAVTLFCMMAANSRCMCIYHDLEKPEELKRLRKF